MILDAIQVGIGNTFNRLLETTDLRLTAIHKFHTADRPPIASPSLGGVAGNRPRRTVRDYSTVTDLARFRGWSTSVPFSTAT